ncbi:MAG: activator of osmoprotectant transporter prop [Massilia sp.]|jgi:ProP effector|nr:activator of osmoprotectant transporter prop [Massilia sp.]MDB5953086.1 activator of osmoprotectant transporter prop [Massilia sp.]
MKSMNPISPVVVEVVDTPAIEVADTLVAEEVVATPSTAVADKPVADNPIADTPVSDAAAAAGAPGAPAPSARALLKQLQQQFPAFRNCLPLAIGIDKQLLARLPGLDRKAMRAALGIHTGSLRYLRAMEKATVRYDLDGVAGAEVTDTHRQHAKEVLQQRFKKEADRKRVEREAGQAERQAEREAEQAEEANRLRQEKLLQLASKFSRNG